MPCVLVYYDLFYFDALLPPLLYPKGVGLQCRSKSVTLIILIWTLSLLVEFIIFIWYRALGHTS
jgi:hypothetical protein